MNTIKDHCEAYVLEVNRRTNGSPHALRVHRILGKFTERHGELPVNELNDGHVLQWLDENGWSQNTRHYILKIIKAALRSSGFSIRVRMPLCRAERRQRIITLETHQFLVQEAKPDLAFVLDALFYTGTLASEVINLDIKHVIDRPEGMLWVRPGAKRRSKLSIAVPTVLEDGVRRLVGDRNDLDPLFVRGDGSRWSYPNLRNAFRKLCHSCGVKDIVFKDYQRSFYMRLSEAGVAPHIIGAILGHALLSEAHHYFHLSPRILLEAVNRAADIPGGLNKAEE